LLLLAGCGNVSPEEKWAMNLNEKCHDMGGTAHWDMEAHTIECYRHPIGRMTKTLFSEKFQ
jgi:hypothetical protein